MSKYTNYLRGRRLEHKVRKSFQAMNSTVVRSAGSKGPIDLVAIGEREVLVIQVKARGQAGRESIDRLRAVRGPVRRQIWEHEGGDAWRVIDVRPAVASASRGDGLRGLALAQWLRDMAEDGEQAAALLQAADEIERLHDTLHGIADEGAMAIDTGQPRNGWAMVSRLVELAQQALGFPLYGQASGQPLPIPSCPLPQPAGIFW